MVDLSSMDSLGGEWIDGDRDNVVIFEVVADGGISSVVVLRRSWIDDGLAVVRTSDERK